MRSYIYYISLLLLALTGMTSCTEHEIEEIDDAQYLELTLSCVNLSSTRAEDAPSTMGGEDEFNENLIETLHCFLYPSNVADGNAVNTVLARKIDVAAGTQKQAVVRIPMDELTLNDVVFPRPYNDCNVYLIANLPAEISGEIDEKIAGKEYSNTSINELKALAINSFKNDETSSTFEKQNSFIMDGAAKATIVSRNKTVAAKGTIDLDRLAAKLTTRISVAESFEDTDGTVWTPQVNSMRIHLDNAVSNTTLGGAFGDSHFDYGLRGYIGTKTETETVDGKDETKTLYVFAPFYSYPCQWEYLKDDALVMYVQLPWLGTSADGNSTRTATCYYKVYPSTMQLDRNSWYNMDLHIGILGSFSPTEEPIVIEDYEYEVINWKNGYGDWSAGLDIETDLLSAHYLVVEQNKYVANNKNTFEIPFVTSHECIIKDYSEDTDGNTANDFKVTKKIFIEDGKPVDKDLDITQQAREGSWITIEGNTIKLNHALNNDFINTKTYDYSPYEFSFYICHKNNPDKFQEKITITQKPAISITARLNSLYDATNGSTKSGYVYVNGGTTSSSSYFGGVGDVQTSGNNSNPYMYTIEVSVLPAGSDFILGDPRTKYELGTDIASQESFALGTPIEGGTNRRLTNYYGTIKDATVENMIAPKFRISSAHGRLPNLINYTTVFNRAASYQEDGYPAGRWRVPTKAEVWFVYKLYLDGLIPPLFYSNTEYWCANGTISPVNNGVEHETNFTTSDTHPVRCVYDEWYWDYSQYPRMEPLGDHPYKYNKFTWGDEIN